MRAIHFNASTMQGHPRLQWLAILLFIVTGLNAQQLPAEQVRADFKALLNRPAVALHPSMESFRTDSVLVEKGFFYSEKDERVPVLVYKPIAGGSKQLPVVICLHGTGGSKEGMKDILYRFSKAGFMAVSIDGRFHGERKTGGASNSYTEAIIRAWQKKDSVRRYPFFYDTAYDLWKLVDYLLERKDVDSARIGMMGVSKGGIETWMAASVDTRIKVAVPVIAAQSFQWSLENNRWQGRAKTIWEVHTQVARDRGDTGVNKANVKALWDQILPGITSKFDCPSMIRLFAPRPLLILSTENDQNCPLQGARIAFEAATKAYGYVGAGDKLGIDVAPGESHRFTPKHMDLTLEWFKRWL